MALYDWLISRKQKRIRFFTEQKVAIIEDVKENEKFKVAKEIIEKYGTKSEVKELFGPTTSDNKLTNGRQNNICTDLKKRRIEPEEGASTSMKEEQSSKSVPKLYEIRDSGHPFYTNRAPIRPFVEASRTPIDRVLDFVMGENISNR
jgi:DNA modification methylase